MNAADVLRRYANGERNFRGAVLRGANFQGKDLSGADFSEADLCGANFSNANLRGATFINARAGVQRRWRVAQWVIGFGLSALMNFFSAFIYAVFLAFFLTPQAIEDYTIFLGLAVLLVAAVTLYAIARQGLTTRAAGTILIAGAGAVAVAVLGLYIARRAIRGDEKFALARSMGLALGALGGTRFCGADLSSANFSKATLGRTSFHASRQRPTILAQVCWRDAKQLDRARLGGSILADHAVRELLVSGYGYKKDYTDANLQDADLSGANLNAANLKRADLSNAKLHQTDLREANLTATLCVGADFTAAALTGACLESWNIDHTTNLSQVDCQFVFLLERPNELGSRERRPHEPDAVFGPGDFEKLYRKVMNTVQLLLRNGVNPEAFAAAFQQLMQEHPDLSYDSIVGIEKKDGDVLLTLEVRDTADKAAVSRSFLQPYETKVR